jgi:formate hydrogenlyase subunit 3/multisubunit Na+/H+ antiporter MnhD subunit
MNAGVMWILLPLLFSLLLLLLNRMPRASMAIGAVVNTAIVISLLVLQIDFNYFVGNTLIRIEPEWTILGRSLFIENGDRIVLFFFYGLSAAYLWMGLFMDDTPTFAPLSIAIAALFTAAISVESRLYFILFVELAVLLCLPLMTTKLGKREKGEHFLLIFVSLAIPLLLMGGWAADRVAANPIDTAMIDRAVVFLILGYSLMIGVFPFFLWMPQINEESRPIRASFVLSILSFGFLYLLSLIGDTGGWLTSNPILLQWLQVMGFVMIALGGILAAFQDDLGRYLAFGLIIDNGFAFLAMKNAIGGDAQSLYLLLTIRLLIFIVFGLSSAYLHNRGISLTIKGLQGKFRNYPVTFTALFIAIFSFNALPLMANFTVRFSILQSIFGAGNNSQILWPLIGQFGFFLGALRFLGSIVAVSEGSNARTHEFWRARIVFLLAGLVLLIMGLLPAQTTAWIMQIWSLFG